MYGNHWLNMHICSMFTLLWILTYGSSTSTCFYFIVLYEYLSQIPDYLLYFLDPRKNNAIQQSCIELNLIESTFIHFFYVNEAA